MYLVTDDLHIRSYTGTHLKTYLHRTYLHSIAKLRAELFKEYPYFHEPNMLQQIEYVKNAGNYKESIAVLILTPALVGVSIGLPLIAESQDIHQPFIERGLNIENYYFFSASLLLKPYRGRGIGHHFFDVRETHVQHYKKFTHICFCVPPASASDPDRPDDYLSLEDFWRKRGYIHHLDMQCRLPWQPVNKKDPKEKTMTFWIKAVT